MRKLIALLMVCVLAALPLFALAAAGTTEVNDDKLGVAYSIGADWIALDEDTIDALLDLVVATNNTEAMRQALAMVEQMPMMCYYSQSVNGNVTILAQPAGGVTREMLILLKDMLLSQVTDQYAASFGDEVAITADENPYMAGENAYIVMRVAAAAPQGMYEGVNQDIYMTVVGDKLININVTNPAELGQESVDAMLESLRAL